MNGEKFEKKEKVVLTSERIEDFLLKGDYPQHGPFVY